MASASKLENVSTKQQRIAELAKQSPEMGFTSLAHFIDIDWLHQAYLRGKKGSGPICPLSASGRRQPAG